MKATGQRPDVLKVTYFVDERRKRHAEISIWRLRFLLLGAAALMATGVGFVLKSLAVGSLLSQEGSTPMVERAQVD